MHSIAAATGGAAAAAGGTAQQPRLVNAAHEFEAQMMKELLKPMTGSNGLDGEDGDSATGSGGALGEFASESLGRALSERGGFGIATGIVDQLSHSSNGTAAAQGTGKVRGNTAMNLHK
jgi:Rod binding domain-containing protein